MSLELTPDTQVHTIWFVGWGTGDLLAYVFQPPAEPWIGEYRFRYHGPKKVGDPFEEDDKKHFYAFQNESPDKLVTMMEAVCKLTAATHAADLVDTLLIQGNGLDAVRELKKMPWCFMKEVAGDQ